MSDKNQVIIDEREIIGFDCHPDIFTAASISGKTPLDATVNWIDDKIPMDSLESWLKKRVTKNDLIVIEASGNTFSTVKRIQKLGLSVVIVESFQASKVKKSYCSTDKTSAVSLAKVYLSGLASIVWMPDEKTLTRREIFKTYNKAVRDTTRNKNRITGFLNQHGLPSFRKSNYLSEKTFQELLTLKDWNEHQRSIIEVLFNDLWYNEKKRKSLKSIMSQEILENPEAFKLIRMYGIREVNAYALTAMIGDINRFENPKKLVAYIGLNPKVNQSGNRDKSAGRSSFGRRDLRALLVQSAHTVFRNPDHPLFTWAWKLRKRKGANVAVIAVARKIVVLCWYLLKGHFTALEEITESLKIKIDKIVSYIGSKKIKSWGYKYVRDYKHEKYNLLLNSG